MGGGEQPSLGHSPIVFSLGGQPLDGAGAGPLAGGPVGDAPTYPALRTDTFSDVPDFRFLIPGTGQVTDLEQCGTWSTSAACSNDTSHFLRHFKNSCDNVLCPVCWSTWATKAARRISSRLRGYIHEANAGQITLDGLDLAQWHKDNTRYLNHYVVSAKLQDVPQDMPLQKIKALGIKKARQMGITGGEGFFHPYRIKQALQHRLKAICREVNHMNQDDREKRYWELVRADALHLGTWQAYVTWGPHFHIIGFGKLPDQHTQEQKDQVREALGGWFVKWVRHVNTERCFDGQNMHDEIQELAAYLLSHSGCEFAPSGRLRNIPIDFGVCGRGQLRQVGKPLQESHQVVCPKCGALVVMGYGAEGDFVPQRDEGGDLIPYALRCSIQQYEIRKRVARRPRQ